MSAYKNKSSDHSDYLTIGLALSGGGSRAIAFHLGCMRALHKLGILDRVNVLSSVSGGSFIAALYAYYDESFEDFEIRVRNHLKHGFISGIVLHTFFSFEIIRIMAAICWSLFATVFKLICLPLNLLKTIKIFNPLISKILTFVDTTPLRFASRSTAFERLLRQSVFGERRICDVQRTNLKVIINATELRTETAFRFGSNVASCWRYGDIEGQAPFVSKAVASSAAYPVFLPAFDEIFTFRQNNKVSKHRVILTDGGVYDNLGVSPLLPGRSPMHTSHTDKIDFIICSVASSGLPKGKRIPNLWQKRMVATFEAVHRRTHSLSFDMLHRLENTGKISGFLLPYLGQNDAKLPFIPDDFVEGKEVESYPTDFNSMTPANIELLSKRGEQLTNILIETYHPKLKDGICGK